MFKGKKFKKERYDSIPNQYLSRSAEMHHGWKGNKVGYSALHEWIYKRKGKASICESCGATEIPIGKKRWFNWANKSGKYKRNLNDWIQLCIICHRKKDHWRERINKKYFESKCWLQRKRNTKGQFL